MQSSTEPTDVLPSTGGERQGEAMPKGRKRRAATMVRSLASARTWQTFSGNVFEPATDGKPLLAGSLAQLEFADQPPYGVIWPPAAAETLGSSLFCGRGLVVSAMQIGGECHGGACHTYDSIHAVCIVDSWTDRILPPVAFTRDRGLCRRADRSNQAPSMGQFAGQVDGEIAQAVCMAGPL